MLLLVLAGCSSLNWPSSGRSEAGDSRSQDGRGAAAGTVTRQEQASEPVFATGQESIARQRAELLDSDELTLAPGQLGYFMDVHEARLRQAIDHTDIGMGRGENRLFVTIPGASSFSQGSARLMTGIRTPLERLAAILAEFDNSLLLINGHTDNQGEADFNRELSERRALAVARFLADQGVAPKRMVVIGQGETQPAASNDTPQGRAANRRVEIVVEPLTRKPAERD